MPTVEKLCLWEVVVNEMPIIGTFLHAIGASLVHLEFAFCITPNLEGPFEISLALSRILMTICRRTQTRY
jgi:hypothetical protein